nr:PREDICTED: tetraspanin-15-like [Latimeria chalumnae]|eukprot:XP_006006735.1 PREDICTED: tetraspanin-15-like [Latimeria chalumnae]
MKTGPLILNLVSLLQILGLIILCIGIYAEVERQKHKTLEGIFLAPAVILLLLGIVMFIVSFIGMVGSLRDNEQLLKAFFGILLVIFAVQIIIIVIELIFENMMLPLFHSNIQQGIKHYYDDLDFKNILDFVQEKFACCGGDEFQDWSFNQYHTCNSTGPLACGVPYTCCIRQKVFGEVANTLCGYKTLEKERLELVNIIYVRGCIHAVSLWFKDNIGVTLGLIFGLLLPQVFGIAMSWQYWMLLKAIRGEDTVDFRILGLPVDFKQLDLSGAGWCLCLPREGGYLPVGSDDNNEEETEEAGPVMGPPPSEGRAPATESNQSIHNGLGQDVIDNSTDSNC